MGLSKRHRISNSSLPSWLFYWKFTLSPPPPFHNYQQHHMSHEETTLLMGSISIDEGEEETSLWLFWRNFVLINVFMAFAVLISMFFDIRVYRIACSFHFLFFTVYLMYMYRCLMEEHLAQMEVDRRRRVCECV